MMDLISAPLTVLAAGAAGSLLRVVIAPPAKRTLLAVNIINGALMAVFVAPAIVEHWFSASTYNIQRGVAFCIGVVGPLLAEVAVRLIQRRGDGVADQLANSITGKRTEQS